MHNRIAAFIIENGFDGEIIGGLFEAGEVTGGIHGASRLGSCAINVLSLDELPEELLPE